MLSVASRQDLLAHLQSRKDFHAVLALHETSDTHRSPPSFWLTCNGHWMPECGQHACCFADTTDVELSRRQALSITDSVQQVFEHLPMMVAHFGQLPKGVCLFANRQFAEIFGLDERSIVGMTALEVGGKELREEVNRHVRRVLDERTPVTFTCEIAPANGVSRWVEVSVSLTTHSLQARSDKGLFFLITDITERYKAEHAMRESEDRLSRFMSASEEGVIFHRDGLITDANPAASRLFETPVHMLLGRDRKSVV